MISRLTKFLTNHLREQKESYFVHMWNAWKLAGNLLLVTSKCFVHSFFPFLFTKAVSSKIEYLGTLARRLR
jgi:hypothetical protein